MSSVSWAVRVCFARRQCGDGPHVVQTIGQLDDQHPEVLGHRDQHLAHRRGLLGLLGIELDAFQLGDSVDDRSDLGAEPLLHLVAG